MWRQVVRSWPLSGCAGLYMSPCPYGWGILLEICTLTVGGVAIKVGHALETGSVILVCCLTVYLPKDAMGRDECN